MGEKSYEECWINEFHKHLWRSLVAGLNLINYFNDKAQCGNFNIFMPFRFYVKSIKLILEGQKLPFWRFWRLSIQIFEVLNIWKCQKFPKKSKFRAAEMVKMAVFDLLKSAKLILRKIRVEGNLLNFHTEKWPLQKLQVLM